MSSNSTTLSPNYKSRILHTLPTLDRIFENTKTENIKRPSGSDQVNNVIKIDAENIPDFINDFSGVVSHCHVIGTLPLKLSTDPNSTCSTPTNSRALKHASAMALAVDHLNTGNSSIISTLGELRKSMCSDLTFTIEYVDTEDIPGTAIDEVMGVMERKVEDYGYRMPCSFVGAGRSAVTTSSALLTGHKGYMEVSGLSTTSQLDDIVQYPHFARTIPPEADNVIPIINYFTNFLNLEHLAVLYMNEPYGNSFAEALVRETEKVGAPKIRRISIDSEGDTIDRALRELETSQYRYVLAVMRDTSFYDKVLKTAFDMGLAGNGNYQWYFSDSFMISTVNDTNTALRKVYNGTGMFSATVGQQTNNTNFKNFVSQLRDLTTSREDMRFINSISSSCLEKPFNENKESADVDNILSDNSVTINPSYDFLAFTYDATIAVGISACYAIGNGPNFTAAAQFDLLAKKTRFYGATGLVEFDKRTGSRTYNSTFYELTNYVTEERLDEETGKTKTNFKTAITNSFFGGEWIDVEGPFIFSNGMSKPDQPNELQPANDESPTSTHMTRLALFCSAFSIVLAIGFGVWTWRCRDTRVIKASQPFFLYLILFGVIMVAGSILPYSMNEHAFSLNTCSIGCEAVLWLLFPGLSTIFSALFTKTYRINLIMKNSKKFRRVTVTVWQTLSTMGIMLILNFLTLTIMSIKDPPTFVKKTDFLDQFDRPALTYGQCSWEKQKPYIISLFAINLLIASLSAYQSWEARQLSTEFQESKYIFATLLITLTVLMVGLPIIIMSQSKPATSVFIYSAAIFIFCMNVFFLIFVPKIRFHYKKNAGRETIKEGNDSIENEFGDMILTTTSPRILAMQVVELQKLLQEKENQEKENKCNCTDAKTEGITTL